MKEINKITNAYDKQIDKQKIWWTNQQTKRQQHKRRQSRERIVDEEGKQNLKKRINK